MANDLSFNVIALDKASATFIKLAETVELVQKKIERLDGQDATVDVNVKADEGRKALDSFQNRFVLMGSAVAAGSPAIGAAITAGVGAGFIAVAALAQKSNAEVQQTYQTLWKNVVSDTKAATDDLVPNLVGAGRAIGHTFEQLQPQIQAAFKAAGPDIDQLTRGVTSFATNAVPGMSTAMQQSLPVFQGVAGAADSLGAAVGSSFASIGQNASSYGTVVQTFGQITGTVLTLAVTLINDLAQAWAQNGAQISATVGSVAQVIAGLASGALPLVSAGLGAAARIMGAVADVLEPLAPLLGTVGTAALATWAAFKLASAVTDGVKALANGVLNLGVQFEAGAGKAAVAGSTIQAAGTRAATAATGFAASAEALAGPVGIAIAAATLGFGLLSAGMDDTTQSGTALAGSLDGVSAALQASGGAINASVVATLTGSKSFKEATAAGEEFKQSQEAIIGAVTGGKDALNAYLGPLKQALASMGEAASVDADVNKDAQALDAFIKKIQGLSDEWASQQKQAAAASEALKAHGFALTHTTGGLNAANDAAAAFGISQQAAIAGLENIASASGDASVGLQDVTQKFAKASLASANAAAAISKTFEDADRQVVQASQSVESAQHGVAKAGQAVQDAMHGEAQAAKALAQAQQGVADAQRGVVTAQRSYTQAQEAERDAQRALSAARQQAVRDLQALHAQLEDQFTNEASARVRLFDARTTGAELGVNGSNARGIADQVVTAENEKQVKAAIDLLSAQNGLNNAMQSGARLREDVAKADAAGVEGSAGVVSAQKQVVAAHQQVSDASYGVEQAQRALKRAQDAVSDASYAQQKAHQAVADAQYAQRQASQQLTNAQNGLREAQDNASRSLDITTEAGRRNLGQLQQLADAIKNQFGPTADGYNALIQTTADKFGITTGAAESLLKKLGDIPQDFKFGMTAVASANFDELNRIYDDKFGGRIGPVSPTSAHALAAGGHVRGPGGPRDDMIDAKLSDGEYVQNAAAVDYYGVSFMDAINKKRLPRFADGGLVGPELNYLLSTAGTAYQTAGHTLETMGFPHPPLLPKYVPPAISLGPIGPVGGVSGDRAANKAIVQQVFASMFGWTGAEWEAANALIMGESGYQNAVKNKVSTAYGMFQFLDSTWGGYGIPKTSDPYQQSVAGGRYIKARYGDPIHALAAWQSRHPHWYADGGLVSKTARAMAYDNGGELQPGWTSVYNGTGKPENVRTAAAEDALGQKLDALTNEVRLLNRRPIQIQGDVILDRREFGQVVFKAMDDAAFQGSRGRL
ncbi:hypothetical protein [Amycolatopsis sp. cmx-4-68]|uniref:aggregation-promoting factor C-terminal-like domain-containing protein n=1 Tax=Amycolatopsis sp. cmx-4-68 TaxID=2790938 RepID=UPI003977E6DA